jgi:hypothetical protein
MAAPAQDTADRALEPLRDVLEADGYELHTSLHAQTLVLDVRATPAACEDCLVPQGVMESIARGYLSDAFGEAEGITLDIRYPAAAA